MLRILFLSLLFMGVHDSAQAQLRSRFGPVVFDPAVFISTLHINQYHGRGNIRIPEGSHFTLVDTVYSNNQTVGFSMLIEADSLPDWRMWLDFDADLYYRYRLVKIFAQRQVKDDEMKPFDTFCSWIEKVQRRNIGEVVIEDGLRRWPWQRRTDYYLTARWVKTEDQGDWLTLELAKGEYGQ